jgi:hypothetical protein
MSTASLGAMVRVGYGWFCCWWSCEGGWLFRTGW